MKKFKKNKKQAYVAPDVAAKRFHKLFALGSAGALVLLVGIIYGYFAITKWFVARNVKQLESTDPDARIQGMLSAARSSYYDQIPRICDLLRADQSDKVRREAVAALVRMKHRTAVPSLIYALGDPIDAVANEAMNGLRSLADKDFDWPMVLAWWDKHKAEYARAYRNPADSGVPIVDDMAKLLQSKDRITRFGAVQRLYLLKSAAAEATLKAAANDPDEKVKLLADDALKAIQKRTGAAK